MNNKQDLLEIIEKTEYIRSLFHVVGGNGMISSKIVSDVQEFENWRAALQFQLQKLKDQNIKDQFLANTLNIINENWDGWADESYFTRCLYKLN